MNSDPGFVTEKQCGLHGLCHLLSSHQILVLDSGTPSRKASLWEKLGNSQVPGRPLNTLVLPHFWLSLIYLDFQVRFHLTKQFHAFIFFILNHRTRSSFGALCFEKILTSVIFILFLKDSPPQKQKQKTNKRKQTKNCSGLGSFQVIFLLLSFLFIYTATYYFKISICVLCLPLQSK